MEHNNDFGFYQEHTKSAKSAKKAKSAAQAAALSRSMAESRAAPATGASPAPAPWVIDADDDAGNGAWYKLSGGWMKDRHGANHTK